MKTDGFFKTILCSLMAIAVAITQISCEKDDDNNNVGNEYSLSGTASGNQEVPPVTTTASGTLSGTYNKDNNLLTYSVNWTGLTGGVVTGAHFHGPAMPGVSAGVIFALNIINSAITGSASGSVVITETEESYLLAGQMYFNIHNATYPAGEIRGQVSATIK